MKFSPNYLTTLCLSGKGRKIERIFHIKNRENSKRKEKLRAGFVGMKKKLLNSYRICVFFVAECDFSKQLLTNSPVECFNNKKFNKKSCKNQFLKVKNFTLHIK